MANACKAKLKTMKKDIVVIPGIYSTVPSINGSVSDGKGGHGPPLSKNGCLSLRYHWSLKLTNRLYIFLTALLGILFATNVPLTQISHSRLRTYSLWAPFLWYRRREDSRPVPGCWWNHVHRLEQSGRCQCWHTPISQVCVYGIVVIKYLQNNHL